VNAVVKAGGIPLILPIVTEFIDEYIDVIDGLLISGGGDVNPWIYNEQPSKWLRRVNPLRDIFEIELVKRAVKEKLPVLGICRGIQLINVALGGTLIQDIEHEVKSDIPHSLTNVPRSFRAHLVKLDPNSKLAQILGVLELKVNSFHHQAVKALGNGLKAVAYAPDGVIEAIENIDGSYIVGVQWHPEEMLDEVQLKLFKSLIKATKDR